MAILTRLEPAYRILANGTAQSAAPGSLMLYFWLLLKRLNWAHKASSRLYYSAYFLVFGLISLPHLILSRYKQNYTGVYYTMLLTILEMTVSLSNIAFSFFFIHRWKEGNIIEHIEDSGEPIIALSDMLAIFVGCLLPAFLFAWLHPNRDYNTAVYQPVFDRVAAAANNEQIYIEDTRYNEFQQYQLDITYSTHKAFAIADRPLLPQSIASLKTKEFWYNIYLAAKKKRRIQRILFSIARGALVPGIYLFLFELIIPALQNNIILFASILVGAVVGLLSGILYEFSPYGKLGYAREFLDFLLATALVFIQMANTMYYGWLALATGKWNSQGIQVNFGVILTAIMLTLILVPKHTLAKFDHKKMMFYSKNTNKDDDRQMLLNPYENTNDQKKVIVSAVSDSMLGSLTLFPPKKANEELQFQPTENNFAAYTN